MAQKAEYGRGHPKFLEYVEFIVNHPNYKGMPDVYLDDGNIQWEAPSNRTGGKFKDTHHKRRSWWMNKAREIGIDPDSSNWISRTAKQIHPTKMKPCKSCGKVMDIRYSYPSYHLVNRLKKLDFINDHFSIDKLEHISFVVKLLFQRYGKKFLSSLPKILKAKGIAIPSIPLELDAWLKWIDEEYIPREPSTLSPGVMSNAPDRFDGFHSFNLCCRATTDPGRSKENLQAYVTDRRVFEYWVDGDWISADRLMGLIRSEERIKAVSCLNGHPGPCSADHIGPISLGFSHRPEFQLLCHSCNSGKNNRMYLSDVKYLIDVEKTGESVVSWYCKDIWNKCKIRVKNEENALRISKILRDNRHTVMSIFYEIAKSGHYSFLGSLLNLEYAEREPEFVNLKISGHRTQFDKIAFGKRTTKYTLEQKARRIRIAFHSLFEYIEKPSRNAFIISNNSIRKSIDTALHLLEKKSDDLKQLDKSLHTLIFDAVVREEMFREISSKIPNRSALPDIYSKAYYELNTAMSLVADILDDMWDDDRYVRGELFVLNDT